MKFLTHCLFLVILLSQSSCATLIFGGREKIVILTNVPDPAIKLNDRPALKVDTNRQSRTIAVSRRESQPKIEISKQGYETQTIELTRTKLKNGVMFDAFGVILGGASFFAGALLKQSSQQLAELKSLQNNTGISSSGLFNPAPLYVLGSVFLLSAIVDMSAQAYKTFTHRQIRVDLVPQVSPVVRDSVETLACTLVELKLLPGEKIGEAYKAKARNFQPEKEISWSGDPVLSPDEIEARINKDLDQTGYPVPGLRERSGSDSPLPRYTIRALIQDLHLDEYAYANYQQVRDQQAAGNFVLLRSDVDENLALNITWTVFDSRQNKIIFEKETSASVWGKNQSYKALAFQSLSGALKKLMAAAEFRSLLKKKAP